MCSRLNLSLDDPNRTIARPRRQDNARDRIDFGAVSRDKDVVTRQSGRLQSRNA